MGRTAVTLGEIIDYFRWNRERRAESTFASDRVFALLDAYDERGREAEAAILALKRNMLPAFMMLAECELTGEPLDDERVVYHFMGSGASDMVTVGQFRAALALANAYLEKYQGETDEVSS
jgi:hypothetical protein